MSPRAIANEAAAGPYKVNSLILDERSDPLDGRVVWDPARSLWNGGMLAATLILGPIYVSVGAFVVFVVLLEVTMLAGHSVGFHRRLIHRSFECPKWLEYLLVWAGTLVGMQGPLWMIHSHDTRDWGQRQRECHPYLRHGQGRWKDAWWSLHCRLELRHPPGFDPGPGIADDRFHRFLQRTWMLHQVPLALLLFAIGGVPWVVWGICVRVTVGVTMHWFVGYICHSHGPQSWVVNNGAVQAHNVPWAALFSMGESWHNNHHAFPASARHGLYPGQIDLGFGFIRWLERCGMAWNVQVPELLPRRAGLIAVAPDAESIFATKAPR